MVGNKMETSGNLGESESTQAIGKMEPPSGLEPETYWLRIVPIAILTWDQKEKIAKIKGFPISCYSSLHAILAHSGSKSDSRT